MPDCSEMGQLVNDVAMIHGADPKVRDIDDVVDRIQKDFPELTRDNVVDAIVEASQSRMRTQSDASKKLQQLRLEAKQTSEPFQRQKIQKQMTALQDEIDHPALPLPKQSPELSKQMEALAYQRDRLRSQKRQMIESLKPKTTWQEGLGVASEVSNLSRSMETGFNLHQIMRQGGILTLSFPQHVPEAIVNMIRAIGSPVADHAINEELYNRANSPLNAKAGLYLAPMEDSSPLSSREESIASKIASKIPLLGRGIRGFRTYLNFMRVSAMDTLYSTMPRNGEPTLDEAKALAHAVNVFTGRGSLPGGLEKAATALNTVFFSPRYIASRFQTLLGEPLYGGNMATRKAIAGVYAKYAIGVGLIYGLGQLAGGTVEKDPRSSDAGKMKFGNTRLDPLSGLAQVTRFTSEVVSGEQKKLNGQIVPLVGNVPRHGTTLTDVTANFLRSKLAPIPSAAWDLRTGKDITGQPVTPGSAALGAFIPLSMRDVKKAIEDQGVEKGTALSLASMLGMGLQTYTKDRP